MTRPSRLGPLVHARLPPAPGGWIYPVTEEYDTAKTVIHIFHGDDASLATGSHVAERVRQVAGASQVELEVFLFGPAQRALSDTAPGVIIDFNAQIDLLIGEGVSVGACRNAANGAGVEGALESRGLALQFARDAYVRWALDGATVINF